MSRFKRIKNKTSKKSSVSINEKIAALNKELGKTGMLSEITNSTDGVYSTSIYVPPQEYIEADVPDTSGITGAGFNQSSAGSGVEGDAPNHSSVSDLFNDTVNATIFPSTEVGGKQGYGIVIGPSFGAGTTYGIIEEGNTYRAILGGFLAGGTRGSAHYKEVLDNKISAGRPQEEIDDAEEHYLLAVQVEAALIKIGYDTTLFNVTWKAWRSPILFEDLSGSPSYNHPTKGLLYLTGFSMLGTRNRYAEQDARRETTTNPQRRGLEDPPLYPGPIPPGLWPPLSPGAYNYLKQKAGGPEIALPPAAVLAAMAALGIAFKGAESAWKMYRKYKKQIDEKMQEMKRRQTASTSGDGTNVASLSRDDAFVLYQIIKGSSERGTSSPSRTNAINQLKKHRPDILQHLSNLGYV